jgi:hypothetical protein
LFTESPRVWILGKLASGIRSSRKLRKQEGIREMGLLDPISLTAERQAILSQAALSRALLWS